jgi:hypothetical protein
MRLLKADNGSAAIFGLVLYFEPRLPIDRSAEHAHRFLHDGLGIPAESLIKGGQRQAA